MCMAARVEFKAFGRRGSKKSGSVHVCESHTHIIRGPKTLKLCPPETRHIIHVSTRNWPFYYMCVWLTHNMNRIQEMLGSPYLLDTSCLLPELCGSQSVEEHIWELHMSCMAGKGGKRDRQQQIPMLIWQLAHKTEYLHLHIELG